MQRILSLLTQLPQKVQYPVYRIHFQHACETWKTRARVRHAKEEEERKFQSKAIYLLGRPNNVTDSNDTCCVPISRFFSQELLNVKNLLSK